MASYSPVFSAPFILYSEAAPNTEFEVPSNFTAVLRDFTCHTTAGETYADLYVSDGDGGPEVTVWTLNPTGLEVPTQWQGRVVVPGGGLIRIYQYTLGVGCTIYVGGYLLRNSLS